MKIDTITPAQKAKFGEWAKQWIDIGLSTEPADFDKATAAALRAYEAANLKRPMIVLRMGSPFGATVGGTLAWMMLKKIKDDPSIRDSIRDIVWDGVRARVWDSVGDSVRVSVWDGVLAGVRDSVWDSVGDSVRSSIRDSVGASVGASVGDSVWDSVRDSVRDSVGDSIKDRVGDSVWDSIRDSVGDSVWDSVLDSVLDSVGDSVGNSYSGALYASWGAYVSFFRDIMSWEDTCLEKFSIDEDLMKSCGWVWWHSNVLAISDRPAIINRDDAGRLHCENGPSIAYRDGWALHHWHGVKVPAHWIENRSVLDPKEVIKSENVEQRAAGAAIVGWPKMLSVLKAKVVNDSGSPDIGQLIELKLPGLNQAGRFLKAHCPRNGIIVEGVPRVSDIDGLPIDTALAAQAWRIGDPQSEYQHPTRRT